MIFVEQKWSSALASVDDPKSFTSFNPDQPLSFTNRSEQELVDYDEGLFINHLGRGWGDWIWSKSHIFKFLYEQKCTKGIRGGV